MARHFRRLILWLLAGIATLALLALCALAALWWFIDPDDFRTQIEARASLAIGRPVHLTGRLRWQLGSQIFIASEGGEIANAAGFGPEPLARWSGLRLGIAARPLLDKHVLIDRIDIDGLQLHLQRNAQGMNNWDLQLAGDSGGPATTPVTLRIGAVKLGNATVTWQDAGSGADWRLDELNLNAGLPDDLTAADRQFRNIKLSGRIAGGPLARGGVRFSLQTEALRMAAEQLQIPAFDLQWADATLSGGVVAGFGASPEVTATLALRAPSLRALLATVGVTPPPMTDSTTLGALQLHTSLRYGKGAAALDDLSVTLDNTHLTGKLSLPHIEPLALRFDLAADQADLDRYLEPDDVKSEPFELPLAKLKSLDVKGVLRIRSAKVAGAAAKEVRIDVE